MSLSPGQSLSQYEVVERLGAGGMGEVWRARDTRLGRDAAIKVLPADMAGDADRLRRFEREARALASLNHPHVAQVFGIDDAGGTAFLAMELVEGQDLSQRLAGGALPLDEALQIVGQIAAGLEAAHEAGVVHRDLKPANVRLAPDGTVKLIDFGLAKEVGPRPGGDSTGAEPDSALVTEEGLVLGTPVYMSPEQARGLPVDRRADLWALGCVLFECLAGRRPFGGRSAGEVLAAVLKEQPDWSQLPALPPRVDELLRRCLEKDARMRLRDAGEARVQLQLAASGDHGVAAASAPGAAVRRGLSPLAAALVLLAGLAGGSAITRVLAPGTAADGPATTNAGSAPATRQLRFQLHSLSEPGQQRSLSIAPDGSAVAWASEDRLWLRPLDAWEPRVLVDDVDSPRLLSWSLERRELAYVDDREIWLAPLDGNPARRLTDLEGFSANSMVWTRDGRLAYYSDGQILVRSVDSAQVEVLYTVPEDQGFHLDGLVPLDGGGFLTIRHDDAGDRELVVRLRDGELEEAARHPGHELIDLRRSGDRLILRTQDEAEDRWWWQPLGRDGPEGALRATAFEDQYVDFAEDGTICMARIEGATQARLVRVSHEGAVSPLSREHPGVMLLPATRSDGHQLLYAAIGENGDETTIWSYDMDRDASTFQRTVKGPRPFINVSEDGSYLLTDAMSKVTERFDARPGSEPTTVFEHVVMDTSGDGSMILYTEAMLSSQPLMWDDLTDDQPAVVVSDAVEYSPVGARLSADGRWVLYTSRASGRNEVHLTSPGGRDWQVSLDGADFGFFGRPEDNCLFLVEGQFFGMKGCRVWRVDFQTTPEVQLGRPVELFHIEDRPLLVMGLDSSTGDLLGSATRAPLQARIMVETGWDPER